MEDAVLVELDNDPDVAKLIDTMSLYLSEIPENYKQNLLRIKMLFQTVTTQKASHKLLRGNKSLAKVLASKGDYILGELETLKGLKPELAPYCESTARAVKAMLRKYHGLLDAKYNFRPLARAPKRYRD